MTAATNTSFIRPEEMWRSVGLRANEVVVHLGSGPGFYLIPAAKLVGKQGKAIGIDIRADMLKETESRAEREGVSDIIETVRVNLEDKENKAIESDSGDWVLIANILHQADPNKILSEANRIVKPTGTIIVIEWDVVATPLGPPAEKRISQSEVSKVAAEIGLNQTGDFSPSPYHYGLLFSPKPKAE